MRSFLTAEKERNAWEIERDSLKGLAKLTPKGDLQSRIYYKAKGAYSTYQEESAKWEESYRESSQRKARKSIWEQLRNEPKESVDKQ